jgi:Flp pilus assembly pilin Flp
MEWERQSKHLAGAHPVSRQRPDPKEMVMISLLAQLWSSDDGQDIAEYAVMLAVILVLVVGTIRLIGSNANTAFSQAASAVQ